MTPQSGGASRDFLLSFIKAIGRVGFYGLNHPASNQALSEIRQVLEIIFRDRPEFNMSIVDGKAIIDGVEHPEGNNLAQVFTGLKLHSITFFKGMTPEELSGLLHAITTDTHIPLDDKITQKKISHAKANMVHYVRTGGDIPDNIELADEGLATDIAGLSLDTMIRKVVEKAVKKEEDRKKVFEIVMSRFKSEADSAVADATREITKEKEIIREDKERAESLVANAVAGVITVDKGGNVIMLNPESESVIGKKLKDMVGRPVWEGLAGGHMVVLARDMGSGGPLVKEVVVKGEDNTARTLRTSSALVYNESDKMVGIYSVLSDVTRYREFEQMKKDFVANVTHELRTPVVATKQALSNILSLSSGLGSDQKNMLSIALRNTERLSRLINDILDFSKIEAGRMTIRQEVVESAPLLSEIISTLKPLAESRGIALELRIPKAMPRLFIDRDRITQVLINLLSNAIKFTGKGGAIIVGPRGMKESAGSAFLEIAVQDTGRGMSKEDLAKIFNKFVQVGGKSLSDIAGTGLGLVITKTIIEMHGGYIHVESEAGKGSIFTAGLPMLPEDKVFLTAPAHAESVRQVEKKGLFDRVARWMGEGN